MAPSPKSTRWVFTLNNPTDDEEQLTADFLETTKYGIAGIEVGESGTRHIQGFFILESQQRLSYVRQAFSNRAHYESAKGTSQQASDYCKKDGNYEEYGALPTSQGKRTDLEDFKSWVVSQDSKPTEREIAHQFPALFTRYPRLLLLVEHLQPLPDLVQGDLNPWQLELDQLLETTPDDRSVHFFVDPEGAKGKSWFTRWYISRHFNAAQTLKIGKRDDLTHTIDETKTVFFFDIPRGGMEHFQYTVVEQLKDQLVFSPKYHSKTKILRKPVHVIVFANEDPDMSAMTEDRYVMHYI